MATATGAALRARSILFPLLVALALSACNGDSSSEDTDTDRGPASSEGSSPQPTRLMISGTPGTSMTAGSTYVFQPTVSGVHSGAVTFAIRSQPAWAAFSVATGLLSGSPGAAAVGTYPGIAISVSNDGATVALPPFSLRVLAGSPVDGTCGAAEGVVATSAPTTRLCSSGTASVVGGTGPWTWSCSGSRGGATAHCSVPKEPGSSSTTLHYAPNGNFDSSGNYLLEAAGFNLADVSDVGTLNSLPNGVKGLVWLGLCNGADADFTATVQPFVGNGKLYGFYLMDEPDPTGQYAPLCQASHLLAESDWIHAHVPGAVTFIVMMNLGTPTGPNYANTYNPANTHIDLFGLDPYPVRPQFTGGVDYSVINAGVTAARTAGIPASAIVPLFQAFGGGGYSSWTLPTATQEQQILSTWGALVATPAFDYAYSWGAQDGDQALSTSPALQAVLLIHNTTPN